MKIIISESQYKKILSIISESEEDDEINVLFIGDSLSAGPGYTWNYLLEKIYPNWNVTHIVKGGTRTDWMLNELSAELSKNNYDKVFIYGGTNDMFSLVSEESAFNNIQEMVDMVNENEGTPYVFIGYDAESVMPEKLKPTRYCDPDCMIKSRKRMIDFQKKLKNIQNAVVIPKVKGDNSWTTDGTHPNGTAHQIMANHVENYINTLPEDDTKEESESEDSFFTKLKKFIQNPFGGFFGSGQKLKNNLIDNLENLSESYFRQNLTESEDIEYDGEPIKKPIVKYVQLALQLLGFNLPEHGVDGEFGPETEDAVKKFKKKFNLGNDGILDRETKNKLIDILKGKTIPDSMFKNVQIKKTKNYVPDDVDSFDELMGNSKLTSSNLEKFKDILEENNLDYEDFVNEVKSIGLDVDVAIQQLWAESGFSRDVINCSRVSSANAKGIAQFISSAWSAYGKGSPCNVPDALDAYVKLMDYLLDKFEGRVDLALAGYNSGPYRKVYTDALRDNTPFSELEGQIPTETWNYVNKIIEI